MDSFSSKTEEIVIVGGGISGLSTALALHRKGLRSVVLEKGDSLRKTGVAFSMYTNGWLALDQLGVGTKLRSKAIPLQMWRETWLDDGTIREIPVGKGEFRCVTRRDLIEILAEALPAGTMRFGCHVVGVQTDTLTCHHILRLADESIIRSKVLIGCDGVNSAVADSLKIKPTKVSQIQTLRCLTNYPDGHCFGDVALRLMGNGIMLGVVPVDEKLICWFISWTRPLGDFGNTRDAKILKEAALIKMKDFPPEAVEVVKNSDPETIIYTRVRYRAPWDLLLPSFREGNMTVAGDAMHVMGPFMGQGAASALEDAVVLARCLAQGMCNRNVSSWQLQKSIGKALDKYVRERRIRVIRLSMQTFLRQSMQLPLPVPVKLVILLILVAIFGKPLSHSQYNCGPL
ncbi:FAD_binding_3 domain-containing protein [Cinnamomum micranthum f. kanehirae]|uniref:FAD_binding_3 domain-containing protein n=1 Tax=Cinnamomum micranthum f. kanehirae TaxID=337451 RepID=A0A443NJH2_9MAGN|nr:FAD_binding_3 domain-containing protein [Cinnamomum micranthum f. kanehirae]